VTIGGKLFETKNQSCCNAEIFFKPLNCEILLFRVITGIVSIEDNNQEVFVLSIQPRKPAPAYYTVASKTAPMVACSSKIQILCFNEWINF
jgi:hypothetical protein